MKHILIDTETLGFKESSAVAMLACVAFEFTQPETFEQLVGDGFVAKFDIKEQLSKYQRTTDKDTLEFWRQQPRDIKERTILPHEFDQSLEDGLRDFDAWLKGSGYDFKKSYVWVRGPHFHITKLEDLYRSIGQKPPFNTFKVRDTRTMIDVMTGSDNGKFDLEEPEGFEKNFEPLHDAAFEALKLKTIFNNAMSGD